MWVELKSYVQHSVAAVITTRSEIYLLGNCVLIGSQYDLLKDTFCLLQTNVESLMTQKL